MSKSDLMIDRSRFEVLAQDFLSELFRDLSEKNIEVKKEWQIDHLCYRVDSLARYQQLKMEFADFAELLIESEVNGRLISTFKLYESIKFRDWSIGVVELPAPKISKPTIEGFEHVEVVVDIPFSEIEAKYSHLRLDRGGLLKTLNPELEIVLGLRNIKFHHMTLEQVIDFEKAQAH